MRTLYRQPLVHIAKTTYLGVRVTLSGVL